MTVHEYRTTDGPRFMYVVDLPRGPDGRRRQRRVRGFLTRDAAVAAEQAELVDRRRGVWVDPSNATVAEWLDEWLADVADRLRPASVTAYRSIARTHLVPVLGPVRVSDLNAVRVQAAMRQLGRDRTPQTVQRALHVLRMALRRAVELGVVARDPTEHVRLKPAGPVRESGAWSAADARRFLAHAEAAADPLAALWRLMLDAALRPGEALALRWPDIDLDGQRVTVRRTLTSDPDGRTVVGDRTKGGEVRVLAIGPATAEALRRHRAEQRERRLRLRPVWQETGLVFDDGRGGVVPVYGLGKRFDAAQAGAGVPRLTPHGLRRTSLTLLALSGVPLPVVQRRAGHRKLQTTADHYLKVGEADDRAAAATVADLLAADG